MHSATGELLRTIPLDFKPGAILVGGDDAVYVAGGGRLLKLDGAGRVLATAPTPVAAAKVVIGPDMEAMIADYARQRRHSVEKERKNMLDRLEKRRGEVTSLSATDAGVFITVPSPSDFSYQVHRFNLALKESKPVIEGLRGCCGQMDVQAAAGKLWVAHNARHRIESWDEAGKQLAKFGTRGKVKAGDFGGCCEPKNVCVLANGDILAAESGPPACVKRFSATGKFLGVVALVEAMENCVRVTVDQGPDGRVYLLDTDRGAIRVFGSKG